MYWENLMTDRQPYDPDRMNIDDIDPADVDTLMEWVDHPNTIATHDDLGRAFRAEPPEVQIAEIAAHINNFRRQRAEVADVLIMSGPAEQGPLRQVLDALDASITAGNARIVQLGGEPV